ncbi:MAG TPA: hypothetical protein VMT35_02165 [Ignavibacteriaceae bacterium]|nr:hypothetical protein [Ignavibacteriaceae bacterium]
MSSYLYANDSPVYYMKENIILWTAAFIITFLSGFLQSISSTYYPVSGTFGIEGKKVSYKLDRLHYGKDPYRILIRTDIDSLSGKVEYRRGREKWNIIPLKNAKDILFGDMPAQKAGTEMEYRVLIFYSDNSYFVPSAKPVSIKFLGKISPFINALYYLTLFAGLLLSTRTGLDFFNENEKIKKLGLFTSIIFFVNAFIAAPLRKTYEMGEIGTNAPPVLQIFPAGSIVLFALWVAAVIIIFNIKRYKRAAIISALIALIAFQIFTF